MMANDLMNYEQMTQLALRGVVRDAIRRVIREDGLPGAHHFYITFLTRFPGAEVDASLAKKYPEEITIVLEHQFWDLAANEEDFEVTLKFGGVPKYLRVPYAAITRFHDPSVGFALQFEPPKEMEERPEPPQIATLAPIAKPVVKKTKAAPITKTGKTTKKTTKKKTKKAVSAKLPKDSADNGENTDKDKTDDDEDNVVSLDAFRKK